jgi:hypothetical protein
MKKLARSAGFVVLAVVAAGDSACTITVDTGDDAGTVVPPGDERDEAQVEASTPEDDSATDDGGTCAVGVDSGNAACDACVESSCCGALVACDGEPLDPAGAGTMTDCEEIIACYNDCIVPPAGSGEAPGSQADCTQLCSNGHTQQSATDFQSLQMCLATSCTSACPS